MELFDKTFNAIERKLDLHLRRHTVLAGNVANSETPRFKARDLDFSGELKKALGQEPSPLERTNAAHMDVSSDSGAHIVLDYSGALGADGNNVDLDIAMGKLSTNGSAYSKTADLLNAKLSILRSVLGRGGA